MAGDSYILGGENWTFRGTLTANPIPSREHGYDTGFEHFGDFFRERDDERAADSTAGGVLSRPLRLLRAYSDTVRYTDDVFGGFMTDFAADDPAVVVRADHGEAFGENDVYWHGPTLSPEQTRVPLSSRTVRPDASTSRSHSDDCRTRVSNSGRETAPSLPSATRSSGLDGRGP